MMKNSYIPGLDILKYVMALLIVAGHCELFVEWLNLYDAFAHVTEIAVPTFFAISAYLFFRKLEAAPEESNIIFKHSMRRLLIFFVIWYLLMLPYSIPNFYMKANIKEILFVIPFGCAFGGYWFIKALIINTVILFLCRGKKSLIICAFISLMIYLWGGYDYMYGTLTHKLHPYYTFYYHTIAFTIGALMARYQCLVPKINNTILIIAVVLIFWASFFPNIRVLSKIMYPLFLINIFLNVKNGDIDACKKMRGMSILYYTMHFGFIFLYNYLFQIHELFSNSIIRYIIIVMLITIFSLTILYLEEKEHFAFLKYLH